jgi:hypothetical protein
LTLHFLSRQVTTQVKQSNTNPQSFITLLGHVATLFPLAQEQVPESSTFSNTFKPPDKGTTTFETTINNLHTINMSAVDQVADSMASATINDSNATGTASGENNAAPAGQNDAVIAVVEEGRRLYIGNLAYATTEGDLNDFFKEYLVYVCALVRRIAIRETRSPR